MRILFGRKQSRTACLRSTSDQLFSDIPSNDRLLLLICQGAGKENKKELMFNIISFHLLSKSRGSLKVSFGFTKVSNSERGGDVC